jgi:hypothetical protein
MAVLRDLGEIIVGFVWYNRYSREYGIAGLFFSGCNFFSCAWSDRTTFVMPDAEKRLM